MLNTYIQYVANNVISMQETRRHEEPSKELDSLANRIVDAAYTVHRKKGPGLLERFYRDALIIELGKRGLRVDKEVRVPVYYDNIKLDGDYVLDLIVEDKIVVELKNVDQLTSLHRSQLKTYLDISGCHLGLLINFNCVLMTDNIKRVIHW